LLLGLRATCGIPPLNGFGSYLTERGWPRRHVAPRRLQRADSHTVAAPIDSVRKRAEKGDSILAARHLPAPRTNRTCGSVVNPKRRVSDAILAPRAHDTSGLNRNSFKRVLTAN